MFDPRLQAPTRTRWTILFLLLLISIITYIDRVNISVTARQMMPALGLTDVEMGKIFSAFVLGYALFQIPGGWLGDRFGARRVLTFAVIWWSIFTALTAIAPTLPVINIIGILGSLMLVRFLIGVGESAALPNFNRAVANWHPPHERGLGIGLTIGGIGIGSAMTPPITAWIMVNYGWQNRILCSWINRNCHSATLVLVCDRPSRRSSSRQCSRSPTDWRGSTIFLFSQNPMEIHFEDSDGLVDHSELYLFRICGLCLHVLVLSLSG